MIIFYWLIGVLCFLAVVGLIVFPILALVSAIRESRKPEAQGQKRYSQTIKFIVLTVASFFALVLGLMGYSMLSYIFTVMAVSM